MHLRSLINEEMKIHQLHLLQIWEIKLLHFQYILLIFQLDLLGLLSLGFTTLVRSVSEGLKLETIQAEEYIKTYGF